MRCSSIVFVLIIGKWASRLERDGGYRERAREVVLMAKGGSGVGGDLK